MRGLLVERLRPFAQVAFVATGVRNLALVIPAVLSLPLVERVLDSGSRQSLAILVGIALLVVLVVYTADRVRTRTLGFAANAFDRELIPAAIANSLDTLRDCALLRSFLQGSGMWAWFELPWLVLYLVAIVWLHPLLGGGALSGVALLMLVLALATEIRKVERNDPLVHGARAANDEAEDLLRSAETLVAMRMSQTAIGAWRARHEPFVSRLQHAEQVAAKLGVLARAGSSSLQVGMLALGAWLAIESRLSVGSLIVAALLLGRALQPLEQLIASWPATLAARGAWLRLSRRAPSIVVKAASAPLAAGAVDLDRVSYVPSAGQPASLTNVSLSLAPGQSILVVGPSGCGKTTLARLMLGILRPHSGTIGLNAENIGYVPQEVRLFPGTIADNIARMGPLDSTRIVQAARLAHVHEMIVRMPEGYHTQVCEAGACLSAGQRRRIALARALYAGPGLLVLDEPGADLDPDGALALTKTLAELKERGTTVVIVGQRTTLLEHVDRLAMLRDGTLQTFDRNELLSHASATVLALHAVGIPGSAMTTPLAHRAAPQSL